MAGGGDGRFGNLRDVMELRGGDISDDSSVSLEKSNILAASLATESMSSLPSSYYYLLWSPGFLTKCGIMGASLLGLHISGWDSQVAKIAFRKWVSLTSVLPSTRFLAVPRMVSFQNLVLPLLSSSCCLLQLFINMLVGAGGCAGFNTILGPVRPYLLAFLAYLNIVTGAGIRQSVLRYGIALMPEGISFWNEYTNSQWRKSLSTSAVVTSSGTSNTTEHLLRATMVVDIPAMGCVACINKIESNLRQCAPTKIVDATSWLQADRKGGLARVDFYAESEADLSSMTRRVVDVIEGAGFQGTTVAKIEIQQTDSPESSP